MKQLCFQSKMGINIIFLSLCVIKIANGLLGEQRGVLSDIFNEKPSTSDDGDSTQWIYPELIDDGCEREYPLSPNNDERLSLAYHRYQIVPQIFPVAPTQYVEIEYEDLDSCQPYLGNEVDVCGLTKAPRLKWNCSPYKNYTIVLADLYPLGKKNGPIMQLGVLWWVVNVPGCNVEAGTIINAYQQPLPLYGSGTNRYAMNVREQPPYPIDWSEEPYVSATSQEHRYYFCGSKILQYGLKLVAGNFFTSRFKPCVEEGLDKLDKPPPQYVTKSKARANLPADPYATSR